MKSYYQTKFWNFFLGDSLKLLKWELWDMLEGKVQLLLTSPPFPLNNKKRYWNLQWEEYLEWFISLAPIFSRLLKENWSIVIELWNAWEPWRPIQSLLHLKALIWFLENPDTNFNLCQEFICHNPARLPSPAQWVTVNRIRAIDSYTRFWWISKTDFPKADNKKVLRPYSKSMKKLLENQSYNSWKRPSQHVISEKSFLTNHNWSIVHNVLEIEPIDPDGNSRLPRNVFSIANTSSNNNFIKRCKEIWKVPHPARMQPWMVKFFIDFLTDEWDIVLDPFWWTNTTWYIAEESNRKWVSVELDKEYWDQSKLRFN